MCLQIERKDPEGREKLKTELREEITDKIRYQQIE